MDTDDVKRDIKRRTFSYSLPPAIKKILHPSSSEPKRPRGSDGPDNPKAGDERGSDKHKVKCLKVSKECFRLVIQGCGINRKNVPNPMFNEHKEECAKYLYTGICSKRCRRNDQHVPPSGQRKVEALKFKNECLERYKTCKKPSDPDFG